MSPLEFLKGAPSALMDMLLASAPEEAIKGTATIEHLWVRVPNKREAYAPKHDVLRIDVVGYALKRNAAEQFVVNLS